VVEITKADTIGALKREIEALEDKLKCQRNMYESRIEQLITEHTKVREV
jgi:hypothetical protein